MDYATPILKTLNSFQFHPKPKLLQWHIVLSMMCSYDSFQVFYLRTLPGHKAPFYHSKMSGTLLWSCHWLILQVERLFYQRDTWQIPISQFSLCSEMTFSIYLTRSPYLNTARLLVSSGTVQSPLTYSVLLTHIRYYLIACILIYTVYCLLSIFSHLNVSSVWQRVILHLLTSFQDFQTQSRYSINICGIIIYLAKLKVK